MKLNFKLLFLAFLVTGFSNVFGQEHFRCAHDEMYKKMLLENPQLEADYQRLVQNAKQVTIENGNKRQRFIIPVVFHILHEYGSENISDAQIHDAMRILNEDFQKKNSDTSSVINEFKAIIGDADIEFRLATIDPFGNCTNGITRIFTHETRVGDNFSKFNQWHRSKYLNIWVSKITNDGAAGWTYKPNAVEGTNFFMDGIMILHSYIGSIGTGNPGYSRALTHEIGHWLGLSHTWGDNNDPMQACGDDGIEDTPMTKGFNFCPTVSQASVCDPAIVENFQNFMDYSYCSKMFTADQTSLMRGVVQQSVSGRSTLWQDSTLLETGVMITPAPVCKPVADFSVSLNPNYGDQLLGCENDEFTFTDKSWNGNVTSRQWEFQDGTPSTSSLATQKVKFEGHGWKTVKLIVSNETGSDTVINTRAVYVSPTGWVDHIGPATENFESGNISKWAIFNSPNTPGFEYTSTNGYDNSAALVLRNYKDVSNAIPFTNDAFHYSRLGRSYDAVVSPAYDLRNTTNVTFSFDYAYATQAGSLSELTEEIKVYISRNCGKSWSLLNTIKQGDLISGGNAAGIEFKPNSNIYWKNFSRTVPVNNADERTRFKIEFYSSDYVNNLYLDNINVGGVLSVSENPLNAMEIEVYPNPTSANEGITVTFNANGENTTIDLLDVQGKKLITQINTITSGSVNQKLSLPNGLAAGIYYVNISQGEFNIVKRVVVL